MVRALDLKVLKLAKDSNSILTKEEILRQLEEDIIKRDGLSSKIKLYFLFYRVRGLGVLDLQPETPGFTWYRLKKTGHGYKWAYYWFM